MPGNGMPDAGTSGSPEQANLATNNVSLPLAAEPGVLEVSADFIGNYDPNKLDEQDEARRRELFQAATEYWQRGWRVIPLHHIDDAGNCSCADPECDPRGKHPAFADWQHPGDDAGQDCEWWRAVPEGEVLRPNWRPRANLGLLTGRHSNVFVIDIDPVHGGWETWQRLVDSHPEEPIPSTFIVETGSGGRHYYFRYPEFTVGNPNPWGRGAGIDIRGDGGQVVAPPSVSARGPYQVADDSPVAEAPSWILRAIEEHAKAQRGERSATSPRPAPNGVRRVYGERAVRAQAEKVRQAPQGNRNNELNKAAFALGQLAPDGLVSEETAWAALSDAASAAGLGAGEVRATFLSGWRKGMLEPFAPDWNEEEKDFPARTWDDFGLGDRMADHFGDVLRWCPGKGWLVYRAGVWEGDTDPATNLSAEMLAQSMLDSLPETEGPAYEDDPEAEDRDGTPRAKFFETCRKWRSADAPTRAVRVARRLPVMQMRPADLDADPLQINVRNGCWDAREGRLLPHHPNLMLSKQAAVSYDPEAQCPEWDRFLGEVQPDEQMRAFLYRIWGYSLTADTSEQALFMHHGEGSNGKSVASDVIARIAGGYAQSVPMESLISIRNDGRIRNDIARMNGARILQASEAKEGRQLDEALIKQLTGGETVAARFMRQEFFEFRMSGKIHVTTNHLLHVSPDPAIWRRLHLITWPMTIPEARKDKRLAARLYEKEAPGILNRLLAGLQDWRERKGLCPPVAAQVALEEFRDEENRVRQFVAECLTVTLDAPDTRGLATNSSTALHRVYVAWAGDKSPISLKAFSTRLEKVEKYKKRKIDGVMHFPQLEPRLGSQA